MKRLAPALCAALLVMGVFTATAQSDPTKYGIESASASATSNLAGAHPDFTFSFALKTEQGGVLPSTTRDISIELPPGLLANPGVIPKCSAAQLVGADPEDKSNKTGCPQDSQIGITEVLLTKGPGNSSAFTEPIYNMVSPGGDTVARLGFIADVYPVFVDAHLRSEGDYGVTVKIEGAGSLIPLLSATSTTWGVPADESHDGERITPYESVHNNGAPETPTGKRSSGLMPAPFMVNPTRCGVPRSVRITAASYALPDQPSEVEASLPPITGCGALDFSPKIAFTPTTKAAESPTGMDVELSLPQEGLIHPNLPGEAHLRKTVVTLPEGLTLNPAASAGLAACSETQIGLISSNPIRFADGGPGCPEASKIGTATIETPVLPDAIEGALYLASPARNPFGTLLAGYLVARGQGVTVKLAGRIDIDPISHRITALFDEGPQAPFSVVRLHFKEGPRGALITPPTCGRYDVLSSLSPWSAVDPASPAPGETVKSASSFTTDTGPGGGLCTPPSFVPRLEAWTTKPRAAQFSTLATRLTREDGSERLGRIDITLPRGLTGSLAGTPYCPQAGIEAAQARSGLGQGALELTAPTCPAASQVGEAVAGAGAGPTPFFVPAGKVYLAGPYRGAPLSFAIITPALAGPFDLGDVVVRVALFIDPETGQVTASSDPLPSVLQGIPLDLRDVRVITAPDFARNPTNCAPMQLKATALSADQTQASLTSPFQVGGCSALPFKPKLSLAFKGKTRRTSHPRLIANLKAKPGEANIARAQVKLPPSAFLDNAHIGTICTRVQFAADTCPSGSIYGKASAKTPLLDSPLSGAVYLRSSSHQLPDLVAKLKGPHTQPIEIDLAGRTDSVKGALRNTFEAVPDAPVSRFHLELFGGKRGLVILSSGFCKSPRATVQLTGQNGKAFDTSPVVKSSCKGPKKTSGHKHAGAKH